MKTTREALMGQFNKWLADRELDKEPIMELLEDAFMEGSLAAAKLLTEDVEHAIAEE